MERTLSFLVNKINGVYNKEEWMKEVYETITQEYIEDAIEGVQVYPANWPRRVRLMVKDASVKTKLLTDGIDVFGQHVDLEDDALGPSLRITVIDAPIEMPFEKIVSALQSFGKVVDVQDQYLNIQGRQTGWRTGIKVVTMNSIHKRIPDKLMVTDTFGRQSTVLLMTDRQHYQWKDPHVVKMRSCNRCGSSNHQQQDCTSQDKLCYKCGSSSHLQYQCDKKRNIGYKENESVYVFRGEMSALSNFNKQFPIVVDDQKYICNEQFIVAQKAKLFDDLNAQAEVMKMTDPRKMKPIGNNLRNYEHRKWKAAGMDIITKCNVIKYETHPLALEMLLSTEGKLIGEATEGMEWGIGLSILDDECLNPERWEGANKMGRILMRIRDSILQEKQKKELALQEIESAQNPKPELGDVGQELSRNEKSDMNLMSSTQCLVTTIQDSEDIPDDIFEDSMEWLNPSKHESEIDREKSTVTDCILMIGDSNVKSLELTDEDEPFNLHVVSEPELKISSVPEVVRQQFVADSDDIKVVLVHVGTHDFEKNLPTDLNLLFNQYTSMLNHLNDTFRNALIVASSVLPRAKSNAFQQDFEKVNLEIVHFNEMIKSACEKMPHIMFLQNDESFKQDLEICDHLFQIHDDSGIRLGRQGEGVLEGVFRSTLTETYYKKQLQTEFGLNIMT